MLRPNPVSSTGSELRSRPQEVNGASSGQASPWHRRAEGAGVQLRAASLTRDPRQNGRRELGAGSLLAVRLPGQDVRGVVEDHAPAGARSLVDIGHEDGGDGDIALELGEDVLRAG